jgi:hypothetical protein
MPTPKSTLRRSWAWAGGREIEIRSSIRSRRGYWRMGCDFMAAVGVKVAGCGRGVCQRVVKELSEKCATVTTWRWARMGDSEGV